MTRPTLILLNGFAGVGKSTIARRYVEEDPSALAIEGDRLIVEIPDWQDREREARNDVFEHTKNMAAAHLTLGKDVIVPYLLTNATHAEELERLANEHGAEYVEIYLAVERDEAIRRLLKRGAWGEEGTDPLTDADKPAIDKLWEAMVHETAKRPRSITVQSKEGDIDGTYDAFTAAIRTA